MRTGNNSQQLKAGDESSSGQGKQVDILSIQVSMAASCTDLCYECYHHVQSMRASQLFRLPYLASHKSLTRVMHARDPPMPATSQTRNTEGRKKTDDCAAIAITMIQAILLVFRSINDSLSFSLPAGLLSSAWIYDVLCSTQDPTEPFTNLELENPTYVDSELLSICRSTDFEALKLWNIGSIHGCFDARKRTPVRTYVTDRHTFLHASFLTMYVKLSNLLEKNWKK